MEAGNVASTIESIVAPYVGEVMTRKVKLLTGAYRSDTLTHDKMVGMIAEISAMECLISDLQNAQQQGVVASQQEYGDGKEA
jgi:hypothetical protein